MAVIGLLTTFVIAAFNVAVWLWSSATAIDRACKRLTIASLANAVQAQSMFWNKLGRLCIAVALLTSLLWAFILYFDSSP